ncbi:hypothetical protein L484_005527 [Morus notabilis]|uniref:Uncharacterized protein n=1 Tax=Morus notabilis TaxID=981085 RepID=W9R0S7_9ROSA|nr:hypothetical protein L484_005527 [Morus notabilis]
MADGSSSQSSFKSTRECFKDFLADRYSFLDNYSRFLNRNEPLPSWSSSDVEEFIASDPVHGPTVRNLSAILEGQCVKGPQASAHWWKDRAALPPNFSSASVELFQNLPCFGQAAPEDLFYPSTVQAFSL